MKNRKKQNILKYQLKLRKNEKIYKYLSEII